MSPIDLDKIKEAAAKATPGPWCVEDPLDETLSIVEAGKQTYEWRFIANCTMPDEDDHDFTGAEVKANAKYLAAVDPQTIFNLVAVVEALQELVAIDDDYDLSDQMDGDLCGAVKGYSPRLIAALEKSRAALQPFSHINGEQP